jgi:hypothetical protein
MVYVYMLPYSQVQPTRFVVSKCKGNMLSDKKCHKYIFQYILEITEGATKNSGCLEVYLHQKAIQQHEQNTTSVLALLPYFC